MEFKTGPSKYDNATRLDLQLEIEGVKRVFWTNSVNLIEMINSPLVKFPFETIIVKQDKRYVFT